MLTQDGLIIRARLAEEARLKAEVEAKEKDNKAELPKDETTAVKTRVRPKTK